MICDQTVSILSIPIRTKRSFAKHIRRAMLFSGRTTLAMTGREAASVAMWQSKGLNKTDACAIVFGCRS